MNTKDENKYTKNKTIFIHIGFPKTATTTIQYFLFMNREKLLEQSVLYPETSQMSFNHMGLSSVFNDYLKKEIVSSSDNLIELKKVIDESQCKKIIISAEALIGENPMPFFESFKEYNVRIVVFIRSCYSYLISYFKQIAKEGDREDLFGQNEIGILENIHKYIEIFGINNIVFLNFDKINKNNSIIEHFLSTCEINYTNNFLKVSRVNVAPNDAIVMFLYQMAFLPISKFEFDYISEQLQKAKYENTTYKCNILPRKYLENEKIFAEDIAKQAEFLNDPTWIENTRISRMDYLNIVDKDLPANIQHEIFSVLDDTSRCILKKAMPYANFGSYSAEFLPPMQSIPECYKNVLILLRNRFILQDKNAIFYKKLYETAASELALYKDICKNTVLYKSYIRNIISLNLSTMHNTSILEKLYSLFIKPTFLDIQVDFIISTRLFDAAYYNRSRNIEAEILDLHSSVRHYCISGANSGFNPNFWFNTCKYYEDYPDVLGAGLNPFYHFCKYGFKEGRQFEFADS